MEQKSRLEIMKARAKRCVCKYCGGKLELRRIAFSDYGEARSDHYPGLDDNEKTRRMNVAKICEIMAWGDKNIGILSEEGYSVPVKLEIEQIGQTAVFEDKDLIDTDNAGQTEA